MDQLQSQRLILRNYQANDLERVHLYSALDDFSQYDGWGPNSTTDTQNFISELIKCADAKPRTNFSYAICLKDEDLLIGGCKLRIESSGIASLGYSINPDFQKQGYATEVALTLIDFGFNKLKLQMINADCDTRNSASYKTMEKIGMERVKTIRNHKEVRGILRDFYYYELSNTLAVKSKRCRP